MTNRVLITHEGDKNWKQAGVGLIMVILGVMFMQASAGFGGTLLLVGFIVMIVGLQSRGRRCPSCRTRVSRRASICPQCQNLTGFAV